jgi:UDP-N-acetylglucosamine 1-carboxyvinyltransferase
LERFLIEGGRRLTGTIHVDGSKNAALPLMAASLAIAGPVTLHRVPSLLDVRTMTELLGCLGAEVEYSPAASDAASISDRHVPASSGTIQIDATQASGFTAPYDLVRRMRAGVCVLGPLLARHRRACVALPGGCQIGLRPIDLHLKGLAALGADLRLEGGNIVAESGRLRGTEINLAGPSGSTVTGTCNVLVAAATATGTTVIRSAACEPEVRDLGRFLNAAGARISGLGTPVIEIHGVDQLGPVTHTVISDRIEAATLALAAAITGGDVTMLDAPTEDLAAVLNALREIGVSVESDVRRLRVISGNQRYPVNLTATPFPGLPTDAQAQFIALLTLVPGISVVSDRVFPERFMHVPELLRMGADISVSGGSAVIRGVSSLTGATVMASDLRASAALVLAGLAAEGTTEIRRVHHLDRGYASFETRLNCLGARIVRAPEPSEHQPAAPHFLNIPQGLRKTGGTL